MKGKVGNFENLFENSNNCWKNARVSVWLFLS